MYDVSFVKDVVYILPKDIPLVTSTFPKLYCNCEQVSCRGYIHIRHNIIIGDDRTYKHLPLSLQGLIYFKQHQLENQVNNYCNICGKSTLIKTINVGNPSDEGYVTYTDCSCNDD